MTSSLAIHNIPGRTGRDQAVAEAVRVLAPGGTILIADIRCTRDDAELLHSTGLVATLVPLGRRGWWSGPWTATTAVTATRTGSL